VREFSRESVFGGYGKFEGLFVLSLKARVEKFHYEEGPDPQPTSPSTTCKCSTLDDIKSL